MRSVFNIYVLLRLVNTGLGMLWGFILMAVMIKIVGLTQYANYVLIGAIGLYIASADLGISNILYAQLRNAHLSGSISSMISPARGAIIVYISTSIASVCFYAAYLFGFSMHGADSTCALFLFFFATLANVPWIVIRSAAAAVDRHLEFEIVDFIRRSGQIICLVLLYQIRNPVVVFFLLNITWVAAYFLAFKNLTAGGLSNFSLDPKDLIADFRSFLQKFGSMIIHSAIFVLSDAFIYHFPYAVIPMAWGVGPEIVLFDVFYKFARAAIAFNQIFSSGLLPQLTRNHFLGKKAEVTHTLFYIGGLSLFGMISMNIILHVKADLIFRALLHDKAYLVGGPLLASIAIVSLANAFQNTAGSYIVNIGQVRLAKLLGVVMAGLFAVLAAIVVIVHLSFDVFLLIYSLLYATGALAWGLRALFITLKLNPKEET